jgi:hypothetical protein
MNALETAKDVVRIARTAGLKKESLDVLELKLSLITEQMTALEGQNTSLKEENEKLKIQVKCLEPQPEEISPDTVGILKFFFEQARDVSTGEITAAVSWKQSVVDYHIDVLLKKRFIRETTLGMKTAFGSSETMFGLTTLGRRYAVQYLTT